MLCSGRWQKMKISWHLDPKWRFSEGANGCQWMRWVHNCLSPWVWSASQAKGPRNVVLAGCGSWCSGQDSRRQERIASVPFSFRVCCYNTRYPQNPINQSTGKDPSGSLHGGVVTCCVQDFRKVEEWIHETGTGFDVARPWLPGFRFATKPNHLL